MEHRRAFIAGMLAAGLVPKPTWSDVGSPDFLSAAKKPDGSYVLCGLDDAGGVMFELPLPARGHAAAAHPELAEAVAFARRPGTFAIVINCISGREKARLTAPEDRHFYGHGAFSTNGELLFTTENDFANARGIVGVWDARNGYARISEFASGGTGPHDIRCLPNDQGLVVANGGIETHPATGRTKLNIPTMRSNLCYLDFSGRKFAETTLDQEHQKNSIRHLAISDDGAVAFAMQWQGDLTEDLPLLGIQSRPSNPVTFAPAASVRKLQGYLGSVAMSRDGTKIGVTSPQSSVLQVFEREHLVSETRLEDVSGVAATSNGFFATSGTGRVSTPRGPIIRHRLAWDNHLIAI